jgi:hypothetical protein
MKIQFCYLVENPSVIQVGWEGIRQEIHPTQITRITAATESCFRSYVVDAVTIPLP